MFHVSNYTLQKSRRNLPLFIWLESGKQIAERLVFHISHFIYKFRYLLRMIYNGTMAVW